MREPGPVRGGRSRCEAVEHGHICGARAGWWDGHRYLCSHHRPAPTTPKSQHVVEIEVDLAARYPYTAACTCLWRSWGYLARQAAELVGEDHVATYGQPE